jgi:hypothetical protein
MRVVALLLVLSLLAPQPAEGQFGFLFGLINIVTSGLNTLNNVMTSVNNTLRNVIGPILQAINSAMAAAQQIMGAIFDFQRNVVYPQQAINNARALIGQVQGIYNSIRGTPVAPLCIARTRINANQRHGDKPSTWICERAHVSQDLSI